MESVGSDLVVTALAALHQSEKHVSLLYSKGLLYWVFSDDWPAKNAAAGRLFASLDDACAAELSVAPPGSLGYYNDADLRIAARFLKAYPQGMLLDVGANYGREAIRLALLKRHLGFAVSEGPSVIALEPGPVRHLAAVNIDFHDVREIELLPCAAGAKRTYAPISIAEDNTLSGSLVLQKENRPTLLVKVTPLDDVLSYYNVDAPVFLKVDTQGGESEVLAGLSAFRKDHPICGIFEFSPGIMKRLVDPKDFLKSLLDDFTIIDIGQAHGENRTIERNDIDDFLAEIAASELKLTDLILIDKRIDGFG